MDARDDIDPALEHPPIRASGLAILSMLCAVLSISVCLVAGVVAYFVDDRALAVLLPLPILGVLAVTCGWAAVMRVSRATEPIVGRNAAVIGIVLGLISVIVQGSVISGGLLVYGPLKKKLVPEVSAFITAGQRGDLTVARRRLTAEAGGLDDARLDAFIRAASPASGAWDRADLRLIAVHKAARALIQDAEARGHAAGDRPDAQPWTLFLESDAGPRTIAMAFLDDESLKDGRAPIDDLLVVKPGDACAILRPDGPARAYADYLGLDALPNDG